MYRSFKEALVEFLLPAVLSGCFFLISTHASLQKSVTYDEPSHFSRGIMLLQTGDFRLNRDHPYLSNVLAAWPSLYNGKFKSIELEHSPGWQGASAFKVGQELIWLNGGYVKYTRELLIPGRAVLTMMCAAFIFLFYLFMLHFYGFAAALPATLILCGSPTVLAHSHFFTTDAAAFVSIFSATALLWLYLTAGGSKRSLICFACFVSFSFAALLSKYTAVLIAPVWLALLFLKDAGHSMKRILIRGGLRSLLVATLWCVLLFVAYGCRLQILSDLPVGETRLEYLAASGNALNSFILFLYREIPLPFPEYLLGFLDNIYAHDSLGHQSFLLGHYYSKGIWYYFPLAFMIKEPLPFVLMTVLALIWLSRLTLDNILQQRRLPSSLNGIFFIVPFFLVLLMLRSRFNIGIRHLMPIYPFLALLIGLWCSALMKRSRHFSWMLSVIFSLMFISTLRIHPHYLTYFNESIGGPYHGYLYLRDSNFDWGQNIIQKDLYLARRPDAAFTENLAEIHKNDFLIMRVEYLFARHGSDRQAVLLLAEACRKGELKPIDHIAYTHWVFRADDIRRILSIEQGSPALTIMPSEALPEQPDQARPAPRPAVSRLNLHLYGKILTQYNRA